MATTGVTTGRFAPWAGLLAGLIAWLINQQLGVVLVPWSCALGRTTPILILGLVALALAGAGLFTSLRAVRNGAAGVSEEARRFVGWLSVGLAGVFMLTILAQMLAALLLTGCES